MLWVALAFRVVALAVSIIALRSDSTHGVQDGGCLVRVSPTTGAMLSILRCGY